MGSGYSHVPGGDLYRNRSAMSSTTTVPRSIPTTRKSQQLANLRATPSSDPTYSRLSKRMLPRSVVRAL